MTATPASTIAFAASTRPGLPPGRSEEGGRGRGSVRVETPALTIAYTASTRPGLAPEKSEEGGGGGGGEHEGNDAGHDD